MNAMGVTKGKGKKDCCMPGVGYGCVNKVRRSSIATYSPRVPRWTELSVIFRPKRDQMNERVPSHGVLHNED